MSLLAPPSTGAGAEPENRCRGEDFEEYWAFHLRREHDRVHQARDQDRYDPVA
jgi:hypothetical protein